MQMPAKSDDLAGFFNYGDNTAHLMLANEGHGCWKFGLGGMTGIKKPLSNLIPKNQADRGRVAAKCISICDNVKLCIIGTIANVRRQIMQEKVITP